MTEKYISNKYLPDKAIDALDEAGAKVHNNKSVETPKKILDLEEKIRKITSEKLQFVSEQKFELAAEKRDVEKDLENKLKKEYTDWEEIKKNSDRDISPELTKTQSLPDIYVGISTLVQLAVVTSPP